MHEASQCALSFRYFDDLFTNLSALCLVFCCWTGCWCWTFDTVAQRKAFESSATDGGYDDDGGGYTEFDLHHCDRSNHRRDNGNPVEWNYSDHCLSSWFLVNIVPHSTVVVAGAALSGCTSLALSLVYLVTVVQQNFWNLIKNQKTGYFPLIQKLFQWICLHYTCGVTGILGSMGN